MKDIWAYCVELYGQPGVAETCLEWQAAGGNVPLLLFVAWHSHHKGLLSSSVIKQAELFSDDYSAQCVQPLRLMRQTMKAHRLSDTAGWQMHREQVKQWELAAERYQLEHLASLTPTINGQPLEVIGALNNTEVLMRNMSCLALSNASSEKARQDFIGLIKKV